MSLKRDELIIISLYLNNGGEIVELIKEVGLGDKIYIYTNILKKLEFDKKYYEYIKNTQYLDDYFKILFNAKQIQDLKSDEEKVKKIYELNDIETFIIFACMPNFYRGDKILTEYVENKFFTARFYVIRHNVELEKMDKKKILNFYEEYKQFGWYALSLRMDTVDAGRIDMHLVMIGLAFKDKNLALDLVKYYKLAEKYCQDKPLSGYCLFKELLFEHPVYLYFKKLHNF